MRHVAHRALLPLLAALALIAAGCGSSPARSAGSAGSTDADPALEFAKCMRANGVTNFPDPRGGGGISIPDDINPSAPTFRTAQQACRSHLPGGGIGRATAQQKQAMLNLSVCMRTHGITGFPDPVASAPSSGAGMAFGFGRPGAFILIPQSLDPQSPKFKQAAMACQLPGA